MKKKFAEIKRNVKNSTNVVEDFRIKNSRVHLLGTMQILNTRFSDSNNPTNLGENPIEQIRQKLECIHNERLIPKDLIFSLDWLEKLVTCR